ncbi:MAG TPA: electron transfer flavoprotein subunit alpha/FixB family protein [Candidatus Binataceae bacterium]|nr:electron transfer flavoprotein subunit alpha/FixB family protein [Candidatus Binataceae bacterium]
MGNVVVFAEHHHCQFPKSTLVALQAGAILAERIGSQCLAAILGEDIAALCPGLAQYGCKLLAVQHPALKNYLADAYAQALAAVAEQVDAEYLLATATARGKDLMPRLAARLNAPMASDIVAIETDGTLIRPMYAGNVLAAIELEGPRKVVTVRATAFEPAQPGATAAPIETVAVELKAEQLKMEYIGFNQTKNDRPQLTEARIVVSGGRGLRSGENFKLVLEPLVDVLGAAMGASRAAVDAGFVPNDLQVGQTGKVVAPDLYLAVGISGAIQHLAGMKDSKVIAAINKDPEAPIFNVADYGLVADLFAAVPELTQEIAKLKKG